MHPVPVLGGDGQTRAFGQAAQGFARGGGGFAQGYLGGGSPVDGARIGQGGLHNQVVRFDCDVAVGEGGGAGGDLSDDDIAIVEIQNIPVVPALQAHLLGAALGEADAVAIAGVDQVEALRRLLHVVHAKTVVGEDAVGLVGIFEGREV